MINNVELKGLFQDIKSEKEEAFNLLYERYNKLVYGVAFSVCKNNADSEDVVQNVFSKIYSMDKSKLPSTNEASWLYKVAKNETINIIRKKRNNVNVDDLYDLECSNDDINEIIDKHSFQKLINGLNEKEKEIMSLKVLADLSFDEIGKILGEPVGTVKWRYYKSVNFLKMSLANVAIGIVSFIIGIGMILKKDSNRVELVQEGKTDISISNKDIQIEENVGQIYYSIDGLINDTNTVIGKEDNTNYEFVTLGITCAFFVIAIICLVFFKKYQIKFKNKTSK